MKKKVWASMVVITIAFVFSTSVCFAHDDLGKLFETLAQSSKIIESDLVLDDFLEGNQTTRVIVTLSEPASFQQSMALRPSISNSNGSLKNLTFRNELKGAVQAAQEQVISRLDPDKVQITNRFVYIFGFSVEVTLEGLGELEELDEVASISKDRILVAHLAQGIPLMNASTVRNTYNGSGIAIAICDTGIDYTHPRLGGGGFPNSKVIGGYDCGDDDINPMDAQGHGTCCAGIAAGDLGTVGDYIGGVAHNARLYAVKISFGSSGSAWTSDMIEGWEWCITHQNDDPANPIMVISTSFGGTYYTSNCDAAVPAMTTAAQNAVSAGITLFVSSGNDGGINGMTWPACISHVNSVGAVYDDDVGPHYYSSCSDPTTEADQVTCYSNSASFLTLFAPSHDGYTSDIVGSGGYSSGDYYFAFGGTSAASPYAAGSAACLQSAAQDITGSFLTPAEVRSSFTSTGDLVTDPKVPSITKPRINLQAAVDSLGAPPGNVLWDQPISGSNTIVYACQDFETANDAFDMFIADDFTNTVTWTIESIFVPGNTWNPGCDLTCANTLHFQLYADGGGVPDGDPYGGGNSPVWSLSVPPTDAQVTLSGGVSGYLTDVTLNLTTAINLSPGTYWLVFYPQMDFASCCQYGRHVSDTTNGNEAKVINPLGGFGFPTVWTDVTDPSTYGIAQSDFAFRLEGFSAVLWDNGPLVNSPGTGAGGADESMLQNSSLGMSTYGFGHQKLNGYRVADDFTVSGAGWHIGSITFFAYQTGSDTTSTLTEINYNIWDGSPDDAGSSIVFSDTVTLTAGVNTIWSNIYRVMEITSGDTSRPIMENTVNPGIFLPPGIYWLDWQADGSLVSGPWVPPITINGQATTGNALQYTTSWAAVIDSGTGTQQGLPFIIMGEGGGPLFGDELAVDFGVDGLWHYDGAAWSQLNALNPSGIEEWSGGCAADFSTSGLWNYDGASWSQLTTWNPAVMEAWDSGIAVDFDASGLWYYDGSSWSLLTTNNAENLQAWSGGLAADFGGIGLWNYNGSSWSLLTTSNASGMESWANGLAVDFGGIGLWNYNGSSWGLLTTNNPTILQSWAHGLAANFGSGLWSYDGSSWGLLTTSYAYGMADWNNGLAVDFNAFGLWSHDGSSWSLLTTTDPDDMEGWASGLASDLGGVGLWNYDGSTWSLLTTLNAEDMIDVDLY